MKRKEKQIWNKIVWTEKNEEEEEEEAFESDNNNYNGVYVNSDDRARAPLLYNGNRLTLAPIHVLRTWFIWLFLAIRFIFLDLFLIHFSRWINLHKSHRHTHKHARTHNQSNGISEMKDTLNNSPAKCDLSFRVHLILNRWFLLIANSHSSNVRA